MLVDVLEADISQAVAAGTAPVVILQRPKLSDVSPGAVDPAVGRSHVGGTWFIANGKVYANKSLHFTRDTGRSPDGYVRIPLYCYEVTEAKAEVLVKLGAQLGIMAELQGPADADRMTIALGNVFSRGEDKDGYIVWIGFAFWTKAGDTA